MGTDKISERSVQSTPGSFTHGAISVRTVTKGLAVTEGTIPALTLEAAVGLAVKDLLGRSPLFVVGLGGLEVLVEVAREHAVVKLLDLVGFFAVEFLEALVRGDDVYLPWSQRTEVMSDIAVKTLDLWYSTYSLAVRRIGYYRSASAGC